MIITPNTTIAEAQAYLNINPKKAKPCPCCQQTVKLYTRKVNVRMLLPLFKLTKLNPDIYHHVSTFDMNTSKGEFTKLRYWNLVEMKDNEDTKKKTSGMWRITDKGKLFLKGKITIPLSCDIYNAKVRSFSTERIDIIGALGKNFDYAELMAE